MNPPSVGRPSKPILKTLRIPLPGEPKKLLSIKQERDPKKPKRITLVCRNEKGELLARIWELSDLRKLWAMCQEIMSGRLEEDPEESLVDVETHIEPCPKGCGRYIKWFEWYLVKDGPDPKKRNRFIRCAHCAEGWTRGRRALTLLKGGRDVQTRNSG